MTQRHTRSAFIARGVRLAAGAATLSFLGTGLESATRPSVASAHNVSGNAARAGELYTAMQNNFYLGVSQGYLYNETSPRGRSNPYAYLWPFYEAMAGTIDLFGVGAVPKTDVDDRFAGLAKYHRGSLQGYDSYVKPPGGDRYYDDNAWVGRALIQLHRMNKVAFPSALSGAQDVFAFLETGWDDRVEGDRVGGVYWVKDGGWNFDRGTGPTGGFAKLALHLSELVSDSTQKAAYLVRGRLAYEWVQANLLTKASEGAYAGQLYWDKIDGGGIIDKRYWSYNQGVMVGAGVLLSRLTSEQQYLGQAVTTADAAIAYYNSVGWYSQPVIFNSLFFRNLLLLYAVNPTQYGRFYAAAKSFADMVWDDPKVHNKQKHLIKFDARTSAYKLREQAAMVQLYACLAWSDDASKDLNNLA